MAHPQSFLPHTAPTVDDSGDKLVDFVCVMPCREFLALRGLYIRATSAWGLVATMTSFIAWSQPEPTCSTKGKPQEISRNSVVGASFTDGVWPCICVRVHHLARGMAAMRQAQP